MFNFFDKPTLEDLAQAIKEIYVSRTGECSVDVQHNGTVVGCHGDTRIAAILGAMCIDEPIVIDGEYWTIASFGRDTLSDSTIVCFRGTIGEVGDGYEYDLPNDAIRIALHRANAGDGFYVKAHVYA